MADQEDEDYDYEYDDLEQEDEFKNRDNKGLEVAEKEASEQEVITKYAVMMYLISPLVSTLIAVGVYFLGAKAFKQQDMYDKKFQFIYDWQLGYVYLAVLMLQGMRSALVINANGARAPACVGRPDQHVYKIMDKDGANKDAAYVMLVNTGLLGRFNRAQRGVFNTDEQLPAVLVNTLLTGFVFGPIICVLLLVVVFGRITFGCKYKQSAKARGAGFLPSVIGEGVVSGLLILCTIKGIFHPVLNGRF